MGTLIAVVGNTAVGKTTLVRHLSAATAFFTGLEQHGERPFQQAFAAELTRYGLANQIDYLLLRAEQERAIRIQPGIGLVDGGLDEDFQVFARHFWAKGYLSAAEFALCERFYILARQLLPPPDLFIYLTAPLAVIEQRFRRRSRSLEIAQLADLAALDDLVRSWMASEQTTPIITVDASGDNYCAPEAIANLLAAFHAMETL